MTTFTIANSTVTSRYKDAILFSKILNINSKEYTIRNIVKTFRIEIDDLHKSIASCNNIFINFAIRPDIPLATSNIRTDSFEEKQILELVKTSFDSVIYMKLQNLVCFELSEFRNKLYTNEFLVKVDVHCDNIYFNGRHVYFGVDPFHMTNSSNEIVPSVIKYRLKNDPIHIYHVLDFWNQYYLNLPNPVPKKPPNSAQKYDNLLKEIDLFWKHIRTFQNKSNKEKLKILIILSNKLSFINEALGPHLGIILSNFISSSVEDRNVLVYDQEQSLPAKYTRLLYINAHFQIISNMINVCTYLMLNFYADNDARNYTDDLPRNDLFLKEDHLAAIQEYIIYGNEFFLSFTPSLTPLRQEILAALDISHIDIENYVTSSNVYTPRLFVTNKSIKLTENPSYKFLYKGVPGFKRLQKYLHFLYRKQLSSNEVQ